MANKNIRDLTGQEHGNLKVLGDSGERTSAGNVKWKCECVCGNTVLLISQHLKTKTDLSCGCLNPKFEEYFNKTKKMFEDNGCVCLEQSYKPAKTKWKFICSCGNEGKLYPDDFKKGRRCLECGKKWSFDIRTSDDEIKEAFKNSDDVLERIYFNRRAYVIYKCKEGHVNDKDFTSYKNGNGCKKCSNKATANKLRRTVEDLTIELESYGMEYIKGYRNADNKFTFRCSCGRVSEGYISYLRKGGKCGCEYKKGAENSKYDHTITTEERQTKRRYWEYSEWVREVYKRDDYTCQSCWQYGGKLNAHHIMPYRAYPELRTTLSNGVTLCEYCHRSFHMIYNIKDFDSNDLIDFLEYTKEERGF